MTKVLIASQPNGTIQDNHGEAESKSVEFRLADGTAPDHFDGTLVPTYTDSAGTGSSTAAFTADSRGRLMRYIDSGSYKQIVEPADLTRRESFDFHATPGGRVPAEAVNQTAANVRDILTLRPDSTWGAAPAADVVFNSLNFPGCDPTGVTSSGTALDTAIAACLQAGDPASVTRNATRRLHIPPGTYMRNDGSPVFGVRSVAGFNLRTGGPYSVKFVQAANANSIVDLNGLSRCHFNGFSFDTSGASTLVDVGCKFYWDSAGSGVGTTGQAARSTVTNRFDFIEGVGRCKTLMQIGRDGDSNEVCAMTFGHIRMQGTARYCRGDIGGATSTITNYVGDTMTTALHAGWEVTGYGIPAATTIVSVAGTTITLSAPTTQTVTGGGFHFVEPVIHRTALKIGTGTFGNAYGHVIDEAQVFSCVHGLEVSASGTDIGHVDMIRNAVDIYLANQLLAGCVIHSGRSEVSQKLIDCPGIVSFVNWVAVRDIRWTAGALRGDGEWVAYHAPGKFELDAHLDSNTSTTIKPVVRLAPSRRTIFKGNISADISGAELAEVDAFNLSANVKADINYVPVQANAPPTTSFIPTVASAATTMKVPWSVRMCKVSGTTPITTIPAAGHDGHEMTLVFVTGAANMVVDGGNLKLSANFSPDADDTLTLKSDGTNWWEVCRSVN